MPKSASRNEKGPNPCEFDPCCVLAEWTGLEPAASDVTGRRYNQLNYHSALIETVVGGTGLEPVTSGL